MIPYGRQSISEQDINAVVEVLQSDWLTQGPLVTRFENKLSEISQAKYCVAVCNATAALHIACLALGVGKGDLVWTSANSFVASSNCALYCGAEIDFVDIDSVTYNMSVIALEKKLIEAKAKNALPAVVIPVHFSGQSCEMDKIAALAKTYGFKIVEDASHAIGASYKGKPVGNCEYSDICVFSFHPVKIVTTGEGGALTCNNPEVYRKLSLLRTHGITRDPEFMTQKSPGDWYYEQIDLGFNYRITDIQCALGISQLDRLSSFVKRRNELASKYDEIFAGTSVITPKVKEDCRSSWHLYVVRVKNRNDIFRSMREAKIGVNVHYYPIYKQPYYQKLNKQFTNLEMTEEYGETTLTLPLHFGLTMDDLQYIANTLLTLLK